MESAAERMRDEKVPVDPIERALQTLAALVGAAAVKPLLDGERKDRSSSTIRCQQQADRQVIRNDFSICILRREIIRA